MMSQCLIFFVRVLLTRHAVTTTGNVAIEPAIMPIEKCIAECAIYSASVNCSSLHAAAIRSTPISSMPTWYSEESVSILSIV